MNNLNLPEEAKSSRGFDTKARSASQKKLISLKTQNIVVNSDELEQQSQQKIKRSTVMLALNEERNFHSSLNDSISNIDVLLKSKFHIDITQKDYNLLKTTLSDALYKIRSLSIKIEKYDTTWEKLNYVETKLTEFGSAQMQ